MTKIGLVSFKRGHFACCYAGAASIAAASLIFASLPRCFFFFFFFFSSQNRSWDPVLLFLYIHDSIGSRVWVDDGDPGVRQFVASLEAIFRQENCVSGSFR